MLQKSRLFMSFFLFQQDKIFLFYKPASKVSVEISITIEEGATKFVQSNFVTYF